jgi:hypothetical protein
MSAKSSTPAKRPFAAVSANWRKASKPWETVVTPYLDEIEEMRRRRPRPLSYRKIAQELLQRHGLKVAHSSISSAYNARQEERKVKSMHSSFLQNTKPTENKVVSTDPIEKLRRKPALNRPQEDADWQQKLLVDGPLTK